MFLSLIFPVYDYRAPLKIDQQKFWFDGPTARNVTNKRTGKTLPYYPSAHRMGLVGPRNDETWYKWPNEPFIVQLKSQGRLVAPPIFQIGGARIQARVRRTYTFCRGYLALYAFQFELPNSVSVQRSAIEDLAAQAVGLRAAFEFGDPEPTIAVISNMGDALARLHYSATTSKQSSGRNELKQEVVPGRPVVIATPDRMDPADWGPRFSDVSVAGLRVGSWPTEGDIPHASVCTFADAQSHGLNRVSPWKRAFFAKSYIVGHLVEGPVLERTTAEITNRPLLRWPNRDQEYNQRFDRAVGALTRVRGVLRKLGREQFRNAVNQAVFVDIGRSIDVALTCVNELPKGRYKTMVTMQEKLFEL